MKRFILSTLAVVVLLAGCAPAMQEQVANEQLNALKPCVLDLIFIQDAAQFQTCVVTAVRQTTGEQLTDALTDYLSQADASELDIAIYAINKYFELEPGIVTARDLAEWIVATINKYIDTQQSNALFSILGMAQAQGKTNTPTPKLDYTQEIFDFLASPTFALLLVFIIGLLPSRVKESFIGIIQELRKFYEEKHLAQVAENIVKATEQTQPGVRGSDKFFSAISNFQLQTGIGGTKATNLIEAKVLEMNFHKGAVLQDNFQTAKPLPEIILDDPKNANR